MQRGLDPRAPDIGPQRAVVVIALKRSGHHAFVDWILAHAPAPSVFLNNSRPGLEFRSSKAAAVAKVAASSPPEPVSVATAAQIAGDAATSLVVLNYESRFISNVLAHGWLEGVHRHVPRPIRRLVFLRDPLNNLASVVKRVRNGRYSARQAQLGKTALLFRDYVSLIGNERHFGEPIELVYFDDWLRSVSYRETLARKLGLVGHDMLPEMSQPGGGSSFGALPTDPDERLSSLKARWVVMSDDPLFLAFFFDAESSAVYERFYRDREDAEGMEAVARLRRAAHARPEVGPLYERFVKVGAIQRKLMELEETRTGLERNVLRLLAK